MPVGIDNASSNYTAVTSSQEHILCRSNISVQLNITFTGICSNIATGGGQSAVGFNVAIFCNQAYVGTPDITGISNIAATGFRRDYHSLIRINIATVDYITVFSLDINNLFSLSSTFDIIYNVIVSLEVAKFFSFTGKCSSIR